MPPFLFPLCAVAIFVLFLMFLTYFRRSSGGRKIVRGLTGTNTPDEVVGDLKDARRRALGALPEAEQELARAAARVHELRKAAGIPEVGGNNT
jgi:hypothetical protein